MKIEWRGVFPAVTTQFRPDGELDISATVAHVDRLLAAGVHGFGVQVAPDVQAPVLQSACAVTVQVPSAAQQDPVVAPPPPPPPPPAGQPVPSSAGSVKVAKKMAARDFIVFLTPMGTPLVRDLLLSELEPFQREL